MYSEYNAELARKWLDFLSTNENAKARVEKAMGNSYEFSFDTLEKVRSYIPLIRDYSSTPTKTIINARSSQGLASELTCHGFDRACVLNFADYRVPGGKFLEGSMVQEESLCHTSGLYPILDSFRESYDARINSLNKGAYTHTGIYAEQVPFWVNGRDSYCDILTFAAVNYRSLQRSRATQAEIDNHKKVMKERQEIAYLVPKLFGNVDILILGAWGCGIFKNETYDVAQSWVDCTKKYPNLYKAVYHPIFRGGEKMDIFQYIYDAAGMDVVVERTG